MARTAKGIAKRKASQKARQQTPEHKAKAKAYHKEYRNRPGNAEILLERSRNFRAADRQRSQDYQLKFMYGITRKQHKQMYFKQNGCCALCGKPIEYGNIKTDHNHITGVVRGLTCHHCNIGLGMFFSDEKGIEILKRAIKYLGK